MPIRLAAATQTQEKAPSAAAEKEPEASEESPSPEEEPAASSATAVETKEGESEAAAAAMAAGDAEPTENREPKADDEDEEEKEGKGTVPRNAGPPYTNHHIKKGHRNLSGTPPGHAHSPALSQPINVWAQRPPPRKVIIGLSVHDDVRLNKSANAWKPGMNRESLQADPESKQTQDLFKKVRSILNKVTPENFPQLMKQVKELNINTEEQLKGVVDLIFEKAIDEPSFSVTYGNMCRCLSELKVPTTDDPNTTVSFSKLLLSRCKKLFDKDKEDDVVYISKKKKLDSAASTDRDRLQVELQEAEGIIRRRSKGTFKFLGELYKLKLLTTANIQDFVGKLLENHIEESLECLCSLLTTIGRDFDLVVAKRIMDKYFNQMISIVKEGQTSSQIRFMLQDVIDLRLNNWVPRRADKGPKTLEQVHWDAQIEEQEEQRKVNQQLLSNNTKRQPDLARTAGLKRISALQSTPPPHPSTTPPQKPVFNAWRPLEREHERAVPQRPSLYEDKSEPECSSIPEPVKPEPVVQSPSLKKPKCLQSDASSSEATQSERLWSHGELRQKMERILLEDMAREQKSFNCVKKNLDESKMSSSPYLRELMTAVCKAADKGHTDCRVHAALLQRRSPVVLKTLNSESERQMEAIEELQALIVTLDEPPDLLRIFFDSYCDEDVIAEFAFYKYGIHKDPADLLGKGVALKSVTAFFTWLWEAE